jgi:hypothetical protein
VSFAAYTATVLVDGRRLHYEVMVPQARLRVTLADPWEGSEVIGSVIYLDREKPGLRVSAPLQIEWATAHEELIVAEAVRVWDAVTRACNG